jgi:hypothetical protein
MTLSTLSQPWEILLIDHHLSLTCFKFLMTLLKLTAHSHSGSQFFQTWITVSKNLSVTIQIIAKLSTIKDILQECIISPHQPYTTSHGLNYGLTQRTPSILSKIFKMTRCISSMPKLAESYSILKKQ